MVYVFWEVAGAGTGTGTVTGSGAETGAGFVGYFYSLSAFFIFFYFGRIGAGLLSRLGLLLLATLISKFFFFLFLFVPYSMIARSVPLTFSGISG